MTPGRVLRMLLTGGFAAMQKAEIPKIKVSFPTHAKAVAEIARLRQELVIMEAMTAKRKVGRPKSLKKPEPTKSRGRTPQASKEAMAVFLDLFEADKKKAGSLTDREHINKTQQRFDKKAGRHAHHRDQAEETYQKIRYFRQVTGIKQGTYTQRNATK